MKPLISIVTPSYNQVQFLEQTILSVLEQDYANLEYMVVDGGSQDESLALIQKYASDLCWWISEPDRGQGHAIQKGFRRATGEYLAWINSDDYYLPGAISAAIKVLEENPNWGMVYADVVSINETGKQIKVLKYKNWQLPDLMKFNIIGQPSVVMRRSAYEQAGGISSQYHYLLDHHLWLRIAALGPIGYIPNTWASARFHTEAKNYAQAEKFGEEAARIAAWMEEDERFSEKVKPIQKKVWAGAYRFGARYLSVGNRYQEALKMYRQAWQKDPVVVLKDWKRVGVTILGKFGWDITRRKNG